MSVLLCLPQISWAVGDVRFAVIGDYGTVNPHTTAVARMIKTWDPDFILTTGDNNYPHGAWETIDDNVGSLYSPYIYPYGGKYEKSSVTHNRFWPCLGNHDMGQGGKAEPFFRYFPALDGQYAYDFVSGPVHFFALCSDPRCPDGIDPSSKQIRWFEGKVKESTAPWKVVYYHHPTYSSSVMTPGFKKWPSEHWGKNHERKFDLPLGEWGVSAVLSGHLHLYERFDIDGVPYIINGLGGDERYVFQDESPAIQSKVRFADEPGALCFEASQNRLSLKFITTTGKIIDEYSLQK